MMSTTEDRIESLENQLRIQQSQVRRQRRWNIALGAVVVVGGLMAATGVRSVPDVIQAKKFEVVNDEGKSVVVLRSIQGHGLIASNDKNGVLTFVVVNAVGKGGVFEGSMQTLNSKGQKLVELGATTGGNGFVKTQNGKGQTLVELSATTDGEGVVTTQNGKGQTLVKLAATVDGEGAIQTQNGKGQALVKLGVSASGNGSVTTENGKGQTLVRLGSTPMGGKVLVNNAIGKGVAAVASNPADGSGVVATFDSAGKVTSMTPGP